MKKGVEVGCESNDVKVRIVRLEDIGKEKRPDFAGYYDDTLRSRDPSLANDDVLFLKAETNGVNVPYLCAAAGMKDAKDYDKLDIIAAGVDRDPEQGGLPQWKKREGQATKDWGDGEAAKYLLMTPASVKGMSGGPVIYKSDRALVGLVQGLSRSSNPGATQNHFIPLFKFAEHLRNQGVPPCDRQPGTREAQLECVKNKRAAYQGDTKAIEPKNAEVHCNRRTLSDKKAALYTATEGYKLAGFFTHNKDETAAGGEVGYVQYGMDQQGNITSASVEVKCEGGTGDAKTTLEGRVGRIIDEKEINQSCGVGAQ